MKSILVLMLALSGCAGMTESQADRQHREVQAFLDKMEPQIRADAKRHQEWCELDQANRDYCAAETQVQQEMAEHH
jgi:hypothetical protein